LQKYKTGRQGISVTKAQWTIASPNKAPFAYAGADRSVSERDWVTLDGTLSTDPENDQLTYTWTAPAGITLSSLTAARPTFIAPDVTAETSYTVFLVVNDGNLSSAPVSVTITVKDVFVGTSLTEKPSFKVYPNPTTGIFTVELAGSPGNKAELTIFNMTGVEILRKEISSATKVEVNLKNQLSGIYLVKITRNDQQQLSKIILRKD